MTADRPVAARAILTAFFRRLGAGREEDGLGRPLEGRERIEPFGKCDIRFVGDDLKSRMSIKGELLLDGGDHLRVPVTRIEHGDTAGEIDEPASILVPELGIFGPGGETG